MALRSPFSAHHYRLFFANLMVLAVVTVVCLILWIFGPPQIPLWYSLVAPSEQLAPRFMLLSLPLLSGALFLVTCWFGRKSGLEHEQYLATIGWWTGIGLQIFLLIALLRILKIVL